MLSALQHTSLHPNLLFDGQPCPFTDRLARMGVTVRFHRSSLADAIIASNPDDLAWQNIALGAFLRMDIPQIETECDYILYTDCDVLFIRDPNLSGMTPTYFSVAPEFTINDYKNMNSGVMLMNLAGMRSVGEQLSQFIRLGLPNFQAFDQGALREFFADRFDRLPERLNWKPYWGVNADAEIVHFHGPKPPHVRALLREVHPDLPQIYKDLFDMDRKNYSSLDTLWHSYLERMVELHEKKPGV